MIACAPWFPFPSFVKLMKPSFFSRLISSVVVLTAVHTTTNAASEMDLDRLTPVAADELIPATDFLRRSIIVDPALNDTGTHVAALINSLDGASRLMIVDRETNKSSFIGGSDGTTVYSFTWLDGQHIAYNIASLQGIELGMMVANLADLGGAYPVFQYTSAQIIGVPKDSPMKPIVWLSANGDDTEARLIQIDAAKNAGNYVDVSGDPEALEAALVEVRARNEAQIVRVFPRPEEGYQLGYLAAGDGTPAYGFTQIEGGALLWIWNGTAWDRSPVDPSNLTILEPGEKAGELLVMNAASDGKPNAVHFYDAYTATMGELVFQDLEYDFNGSFYRDPSSRALVGAFYDRNGPSSRWFEDTYKKLQDVFNDYFPGKVVRLLDSDTSGGVFLVALFSDRDPLTYYTLDLVKRTVTKLQNGQPWLDADRMQGTSIVKYTTAEGLKLDAYVTLPAGTTKDNPAPLLVLPHGGPWARSSWGFQGETQFFVSRGYAVFQPNYRSSTGYDWMFTEADRVDFLKMSDDVTRAVKTVLRTGMIDADRVAIVGSGFSGYLVLNGLITEPDLYRCGVAHAGVYDWSWLANELGVDRNRHPVFGPLMTLLGDPGTQAAKFEALSPAREVARIKDPILVSRERDATGVERSQTVRLVNGLKTVGAPHKELFIEGSMAQLENQVRLFNEMDAFLAEHLGMPARPAPTYTTPAEATPAAPTDEAPAVEFKLNN
jgi:pimeloyl-ACP methyl ester carboxylesterase